MDFATAVGRCFAGYASFSGRARRAEFWWFALFLRIGGFLANLLDGAVGTLGAVHGLFILATLLPQAAVTARRLHDTGRSGWWQAAYILPALVLIAAALDPKPQFGLLLGALLALLVGLALGVAWLAAAGERGPNRYGADPLGEMVTPPSGTGEGNSSS